MRTALFAQPRPGVDSGRHWWFDWEATPSEHELACRATEATGEEQPLLALWNYQGMGNSMVERVTVADSLSVGGIGQPAKRAHRSGSGVLAL